MVFSIKQQLWQEVVPILQVWIFIPNIQQLKQFQNLFKILNLEEKKLVIWQMMQDNWCFDTKGSRIHQVCNLGHLYSRKKISLRIVFKLNDFTLASR